MRRRLPRRAAGAALAALLAAIPLFSCSPSPETAWWAHVRWLADDARQGRETGSPGYLAAAQYVAHEFERVGAKPAGTDGYLQPVAFLARKLLEPECFVALAQGARVDTLRLGDDAVLSASTEPAESIDAGAVFVGYGLQLPEAGLRDLDGLDLRGKIAVCFRGAPRGPSSTVAAHAQHLSQRWARLREKGAIGMVTIPNPYARTIPWERVRVGRLEEDFILADSSLHETLGRRFSLFVNPDRAQLWFRGSGHDFGEILAAARRGEVLPRFPLPYRVRARVRMKERAVESSNVIGVIPGSDPALRGESVVLTAHLDHLGIGGAVEGDSIYNGAMDNAAGVATLIEIARALHASKRPPRRSIVLLALTGEEKGLLGSRFFATRPPPGVGRMTASLNLDMFLPIVPLRHVIAYGEDESDLGPWFRAVAESLGVRVQPDPEPEQTIFVRSDQYNLVRAGVPSLFVEMGWGSDSTAARRFKRWRRERYHAPSDDLRQPVDLEAAAAFNRLLLRFCRHVADRSEAPRWKSASFFRRFERAP